MVIVGENCSIWWDRLRSGGKQGARERDWRQAEEGGPFVVARAPV